MRFLKRKTREQPGDLDERVRQAREEADESQRRLHAIRRNVVQPLTEAGTRNQFAEIIRRSLIEGHGGQA
jgi:hypothetical protein